LTPMDTGKIAHGEKPAKGAHHGGHYDFTNGASKKKRRNKKLKTRIPHSRSLRKQFPVNIPLPSEEEVEAALSSTTGRPPISFCFPLGDNQKTTKSFRSEARTAINLVIEFLQTGVWQQVKNQKVIKTPFTQYERSMQENGVAKIILNGSCGYDTDMNYCLSQNKIPTMYATDADEMQLHEQVVQPLHNYRFA
jgi:hypothetical protein